MVTKMQKSKTEKIICKALPPEKGHLIFREATIKVATHFSTETMEAKDQNKTAF